MTCPIGMAAASASHRYAPITTVFKPADDGIEPWLNLGNAAKLLKIAPKTLRLAAEAGEIEAFHPPHGSSPAPR